MPTRPKGQKPPEVWVTSLTKLLSGEHICQWAAWFKTFHWFDPAPNTFDAPKWSMDHSALVRKEVAALTADGYTVTTEDQNKFLIKGTTAHLAGKPDIIAIKGGNGLIVDAKTGMPGPSFPLQVMIYMWAIPKAREEFRHIKFDGKLAFKAGWQPVSQENIPPTLVKELGVLMKTIGGETPPLKSPNYDECKYCKIGSADCPERVTADVIYEGETDEW